MSAKSERPKNRRVKLVGGGYKWTRGGTEATGGSLKAQRRAIRQAMKANVRGKAKEVSVAENRALKVRLAELLAQKDGR